MGNVNTIADGVSATYNESFGYDDLHRLTSATGPYGSLTYAYNQIGNMTCNSQLGSCTATSPNYAYPPSGATAVRPHAVNQAGPNTYTYDANGNMTGGAGRTLSYDVDNRPTSITAGGVTATMAYDYTGERVRKTVGGAMTTYVGALYECSASCTKYIFAGSTRVALKAGTSVLYFHGNHLGSTHVVTDGAGAKAEEIHYYPYGDRYSDTGAVGVMRKYTGQELDSETGLYYYHARYYDPVLGRFVQADTVGVQFTSPQSLNRYSYVRNNPLRYIDPTGHDIDEAGNIVQIVDGKLIIIGGAETSKAGQVYTAEWSPDTGQVQNGWVNRVEAIDPWLDAIRAEGQSHEGGGNSLSIFYKGGSGTSGSGSAIERFALALNRKGRPAVALEANQAHIGGELANTASNRFGWENFNLAGHSLGGGAAVETAWANPSITFQNLFTIDSVCSWGCGMIPRNVGTNYNPYQAGFLGGTVNSLAPKNDTTVIKNWYVPDVTHFSIVDPQQSFVPRFIINTIIAGP